MNGMLACLAWSVVVLHPQTSAGPQDAHRAVGNTPELLSVLPADTVFMFGVHSLSECDGKLSALMERLGFPVSPYTLLKGSLEIVTGLQDTGPAAVAVMPASVPDDPSRRIVLLLPTTDRVALLTFLNPEPPAGDYTRVMLRGRETFVGTKGRFSVLGPDLQTVRSVVEAKTRLVDRFSAGQLERFRDGDMSLWVNTEALPIRKADAAADAPWRLAVSDVVEALSTYRSILGSVRFDTDGLAIDFRAAKARPAKSTEETGTVGSLLAGLPGEPSALAIGLAGDGMHGELLTSAMVSALTVWGVLDPGRSIELRQAYESLAAKTSAVAASVSLLPDGSGGHVAWAKVLRTQGDGRALLRNLERVVGLLKGGPFVDPRFNRLAERIKYRRAAETSGDIVVDHLRVDLSGFKEIDRAALGNVLGSDGLLTRIGVIDEKTVVLAGGGGLPRFRAIVAVVRSGQSPLAADEGIKRAAMKVAGKRSAEAYFSIDRCVRLLNRLGSAVKRPVELPQMPELTMPVAITVATNDPHETQVRVYVPIDLIVAVKDAIMSQVARGVVPGD